MFASRKPDSKWVSLNAGQGGSWSQATLTFDSTFRSLDISAHIPVGTKFVLLVGTMQDNSLGTYIALRNPDTTKNQTPYSKTTAVSGINDGFAVIIGVSPSRTIEYRGGTGIDSFTMTIVAYTK